MNDEIWKDVVGYEGIYKVSNMGNVKRMQRDWRSGRKGCKYKHLDESPVKQRQTAYGYMVCTLCKDGVKLTKRVHILVAQAFIENPNPEFYTVVNHIDFNRANNCVENLEWCSPKENSQYSAEHGRYKNFIYTKAQKEQMMNMYLNGMRPFEIAKQMNIPWPHAYLHTKQFIDSGYTNIH